MTTTSRTRAVAEQQLATPFESWCEEHGVRPSTSAWQYFQATHPSVAD